MTVKNGKWWHMASGLEVIGVILFVVVIVPTIFNLIKGEVADMHYEEARQVEQQELISELIGKVDRLESERVAK